jgi:hypothetical protein
MYDGKMAVHQCGGRGDSSLCFKHTSSSSLALCSVPFEKAGPRRRAFHRWKQEGNRKLGVDEECQIGILPVCCRARCDQPSPNNAKDLRPDRKQTSPFVQSYTRDWAACELKYDQMTARVVDNLFGCEGALLQPRLHVHHLRVDRAQVGDVGLVSI